MQKFASEDLRVFVDFFGFSRIWLTTSSALSSSFHVLCKYKKNTFKYLKHIHCKSLGYIIKGIGPCHVRKDFVVYKAFTKIHPKEHHNHRFCYAGDLVNDTEDINYTSIDP